ncbi:MAG: L-threonylcarbamoyladenylate synthase [Candidatus Saccharibacteria bacterium]|nr:L-threonylcarbamoyladenylate synthase [Candidatus Saccharibacteria bacterium]
MINPETCKVSVKCLNSGEVVVMPTDTVYGLVSLARNPEAVKKMYEAKQRNGKPGTIIAGSVKQLIEMGFDKQQIMLAEQFWPGPVSVILDAPESLDYLHMGKKSLAVRIPALVWLQEVLEATGPLATTSANLPDEPTVTNIDQAKQIFGDKVDLYSDGGEISGVKPSKIVKITDNGQIEIIRN